MTDPATASVMLNAAKIGVDLLTKAISFNADKNKRIDEFKNLIKSHVLFGFYESWKIFSQTVGTKYSPDTDNLLREYAQLYIQVIIQGSEMLPDDLKEKLEEFAKRMIIKTKQLKVGTFSDAYRDIDKLAEEVYKVYKNFDDYQFRAKP
ncbi:MAG: hypothetical protein PHH67_04780 [Methanosarcina sp.]|jgi:hypothetical protein|nr:hypothetical protein [Methanosarcina sp.]MDD3317891.1 hypothetical protein [Methanosarcina sp.]MDD4305815.1 hypothetical protein [Methanosarcina sp.]MDD4620627.1 hypothetical protein [Methanosarcina sp.]NLN43915.1 hypothetical protein [Methanosarcina sp.]